MHHFKHQVDYCEEDLEVMSGQLGFGFNYSTLRVLSCGVKNEDDLKHEENFVYELRKFQQ